MADGSFTMADLNLFLTGIFGGKFYLISKLYVVYSLELPHQGYSNEYSQHTIFV